MLDGGHVHCNNTPINNATGETEMKFNNVSLKSLYNKGQLLTGSVKSWEGTRIDITKDGISRIRTLSGIRYMKLNERDLQDAKKIIEKKGEDSMEDLLIRFWYDNSKMESI
jgi:hypothetical protein